MRWPWTKEAPTPAPSGECVHLWSNWSEPEEIDVRATYTHGWAMNGHSEDREGLSQDRRCLHCNMYQRRLA